ncbi:hypothetical protein CBR_g2841 [Chara braunii]|uniref:Uncharacterized protein n=1 Tax=Chara braunii TaxID=69332 RepID=A0A388KE14_CHABU|nr:hypothetical protein CBR_g2841 [Chara braunii]|eukprot:GBG68295.1 hypothetical protein CBR_g2841 [Chara braunii]
MAATELPPTAQSRMSSTTVHSFLLERYLEDSMRLYGTRKHTHNPHPVTLGEPSNSAFCEPKKGLVCSKPNFDEGGQTGNGVVLHPLPRVSEIQSECLQSVAHSASSPSYWAGYPQSYPHGGKVHDRGHLPLSEGGSECHLSFPNLSDDGLSSKKGELVGHDVLLTAVTPLSLLRLEFTSDDRSLLGGGFLVDSSSVPSAGLISSGMMRTLSSRKSTESGVSDAKLACQPLNLPELGDRGRVSTSSQRDYAGERVLLDSRRQSDSARLSDPDAANYPHSQRSDKSRRRNGLFPAEKASHAGGLRRFSYCDVPICGSFGTGTDYGINLSEPSAGIHLRTDPLEQATPSGLTSRMMTSAPSVASSVGYVNGADFLDRYSWRFEADAAAPAPCGRILDTVAGTKYDPETEAGSSKGYCKNGTQMGMGVGVQDGNHSGRDCEEDEMCPREYKAVAGRRSQQSLLKRDGHFRPSSEPQRHTQTQLQSLVMPMMVPSSPVERQPSTTTGTHQLGSDSRDRRHTGARGFRADMQAALTASKVCEDVSRGQAPECNESDKSAMELASGSVDSVLVQHSRGTQSSSHDGYESNASTRRQATVMSMVDDSLSRLPHGVLGARAIFAMGHKDVAGGLSHGKLSDERTGSEDGGQFRGYSEGHQDSTDFVFHAISGGDLSGPCVPGKVWGGPNGLVSNSIHNKGKTGRFTAVDPGMRNLHQQMRNGKCSDSASSDGNFSVQSLPHLVARDLTTDGSTLRGSTLSQGRGRASSAFSSRPNDESVGLSMYGGGKETSRSRQGADVQLEGRFRSGLKLLPCGNERYISYKEDSDSSFGLKRLQGDRAYESNHDESSSQGRGDLKEGKEKGWSMLSGRQSEGEKNVVDQPEAREGSLSRSESEQAWGVSGPTSAVPSSMSLFPHVKGSNGICHSRSVPTRSNNGQAHPEETAGWLAGDAELGSDRISTPPHSASSQLLVRSSPSPLGNHRWSGSQSSIQIAKLKATGMNSEEVHEELGKLSHLGADLAGRQTYLLSGSPSRATLGVLKINCSPVFAKIPRPAIEVVRRHSWRTAESSLLRTQNSFRSSQAHLSEIQCCTGSLAASSDHASQSAVSRFSGEHDIVKTCGIARQQSNLSAAECTPSDGTPSDGGGSSFDGRLSAPMAATSNSAKLPQWFKQVDGLVSQNPQCVDSWRNMRLRASMEAAKSGWQMSGCRDSAGRPGCHNEDNHCSSSSSSKGGRFCPHCERHQLAAAVFSQGPSVQHSHLEREDSVKLTTSEAHTLSWSPLRHGYHHDHQCDHRAYSQQSENRNSSEFRELSKWNSNTMGSYSTDTALDRAWDNMDEANGSGNGEQEHYVADGECWLPQVRPRPWRREEEECGYSFLRCGCIRRRGHFRKLQRQAKSFCSRRIVRCKRFAARIVRPLLCWQGLQSASTQRPADGRACPPGDAQAWGREPHWLDGTPWLEHRRPQLAKAGVAKCHVANVRCREASASFGSNTGEQPTRVAATWTGGFATTATRLTWSTRSTMPMDSTAALLQGAAQWLSLLQTSHDLLRQKVDEMRMVADGGDALPYLTHQSILQSLLHIIMKLEEGPASYLAWFIDQGQAAILMRHCYAVLEEGQALCALSTERWYAQLDVEDEDDSPSSPSTPM